MRCCRFDAESVALRRICISTASQETGPLPFSIVPFLLLVVPVLEIAAFIVIGGKIGVLATLAMVFVTAVIGSILLRVQGFGLITRIRSEVDRGRVPGRELVHGVMILVAGVLLLTPGFITDTLGFLLFIPPLRDLAWSAIRDRVVVTGYSASAGAAYRARDDGTIDLDEDDYTVDPAPDSPWRAKIDRPKDD